MFLSAALASMVEASTPMRSPLISPASAISETVRRWVLKFGRAYARRIQRRRPRPTERWHLDEMVVVIRGRQFYLWRAVDSEGEVLDFLVQSRRNARAAIRLMRKLLKKQGFAPATIVTDKLRSYGTAIRLLALSAQHEQGLRKNNRAENSHQPVRRRERKMQRFKSPASAQRSDARYGGRRPVRRLCVLLGRSVPVPATGE